jgi:hypothetical protein
LETQLKDYVSEYYCPFACVCNYDETSFRYYSTQGALHQHVVDEHDANPGNVSEMIKHQRLLLLKTFCNRLQTYQTEQEV